MLVVTVAYDEAGKIIGGGFTFVDFVSPKGTAPVEISATMSGTPAKIELYPTLSGLSVIGN